MSLLQDIQNLDIPYLGIRNIHKDECNGIYIELEGGSDTEGKYKPADDFSIYIEQILKLVKVTDSVLYEYAYDCMAERYYITLTTKKYL